MSFVFLPNIFSKLNSDGRIIEKTENIKYIFTRSCFKGTTMNTPFIYTTTLQYALLIDPVMHHF